MLSLKLNIKGMTCENCAKSIEKNVKKIEDITISYVNFTTESAYFEFSQKETIKLIQKKIKDLGFSYSLNTFFSKKKEEDPKKDLKKAFFSFFLTLLIFSLCQDTLKEWPSFMANRYLQFFLATPLWIFLGYRFQKSLLFFVLKGHSTMNTLIGLGTSAAYLYSTFVVLFPTLSLSLGLGETIYFEALGFITSFVLFGQALEQRAKTKTKEALQSLASLAPKKAFVLKKGDYLETNIKDVKENDSLLVKPDEVFPVDGVVEKGFSFVNESMLTGESQLVKKTKGEKVYAGTINETNSLYYQAQQVGEKTVLAQVIEFVQRATTTKPDIQKYADKISSLLTPLILLIASLTFIIWFFVFKESHSALSHFIAVLVVSCPCALGLATPTAVVVALGRASLKGLLIKKGEVLEKACHINTFVFDKTGTLTQGKPSVTEFIGEKSEEFQNDIASICSLSNHPLSKAVVSYTRRKDVKLQQPQNFETIKSKGFTSSLKNKTYLIGSKKLLEENKIPLNPHLTSKENHIASHVHVALNGEHKALFLIKDKVRKEAKKVIKKLKEKNIKTYMLTGDHQQIAKGVASQLNIDDFQAETLTLEKSQYIQNLQKQNNKVAMIGDGINDAPSLAQADLSFAIGEGSDMAITTSDVTLFRAKLSRLTDFLNLSKLTMKVIKQNLFFSFFYNFTLIPLASGFFSFFHSSLTMSPSLASLAMALSSLCVVSNSLRLKKFSFDD